MGKRIGPGSWWKFGQGAWLIAHGYAVIPGTLTGYYAGGVTIGDTDG